MKIPIDFLQAKKDSRTIRGNVVHKSNKVQNKHKNKPLPPGWSQVQDGNGKTYYFHKETNTTQWEWPGQ